MTKDDKLQETVENIFNNALETKVETYKKVEKYQQQQELLRITKMD